MGKLNFTRALKNALPYVLTLILVGIMTFVAEILGEGEIIFPEITALAIGYMVTQKPVSYTHLTLPTILRV